MVRLVGMFALGATLGCGVGDDTDATDTGGGGACGDVTTHVLELRVAVVDGDGAPVEGATVALEERSWEPGTLGTALTGGDGEAVLEDLAVTSVEDCWGTALDYVLVVTDGDRAAEARLNPPLFNAIQAGETVVDRTGDPITVE